MHVIALKIDHTSITGFVMETVPTRKFILSWSLLNEQATDVAQVQLTFMWRRCSSHSLALPFSYKLLTEASLPVAGITATLRAYSLTYEENRICEVECYCVMLELDVSVIHSDMQIRTAPVNLERKPVQWWKREKNRFVVSVSELVSSCLLFIYVHTKSNPI